MAEKEEKKYKDDLKVSLRWINSDGEDVYGCNRRVGTAALSPDVEEEAFGGVPFLPSCHHQWPDSPSLPTSKKEQLRSSAAWCVLSRASGLMQRQDAKSRPDLWFAFYQNL